MFMVNVYYEQVYYEQVHGTAMESALIPIVANLFIKEFETKAINSVTHPSRWWLRYVDDTFVIQKAEYINQFLQHTNSINSHIYLTQETPNT